MTKEWFVERCIEKFGDKFDYSEVDYKNSKTKVRIICPIHGEFSIRPQAFLTSPYGCPKCAHKEGGKKRGETQTKNTEQFIEEARKVHGDKYGYSKVEYIGNHVKVCIVCPKHGEFWQEPNNHLSGYGCKKCAAETISEAQANSTEWFINEATKVYGTKYDYSKVDYKNALTKVCIICPKHGEFWQEPHNHLRGHGCPYCANKFKTTSDFITMARAVHGDKYDYSKSVYKDSHEKIEIICPKHGSFWQAPFNHIQGHGCPKCTSPISKWEQEIFDFLTSIGVKCEQSNRTVLDGMEIDIFIPLMNIGIECDGLRWHSEEFRGKDYHLAKSDECSKAGIRLIHIFEDEWVKKRPIIESMLRNILGLTLERIPARKCEIRQVEPSDRIKFLNDNHIQGNAQSSINLGLYYKDELVSLMTFGKPRINMGGKSDRYEYELVRFCNKAGITVVGGASRLFRRFIDEYKPNGVITYSDKRWSLGNMYRVLGFRHDHDSPPNYFYVDGMNRLNRFGFRKSVLVKEGYDPGKTEREIMAERGFSRIYDCGTMVWVFNC